MKLSHWNYPNGILLWSSPIGIFRLELSLLIVPFGILPLEFAHSNSFIGTFPLEVSH